MAQRLVSAVTGEAPESANFGANAVRLPPWLVLYLLGQLPALLGAAWWSSALSSKVDYLQAGMAEMRQELKVMDLQHQADVKEFDQRVREAIRAQLADGGWTRIRTDK